jgi:peptidyl-prolyl cis-trans isomerase SurA
MTRTPAALAARRATIAFAALLATTLAACRSTPPAPAPVSADTWAQVNGRDITRQEVDKAFERNRDASQPLSDEEALTTKLALLDDMITQELLIAQAAELQIQVPDSEIDTAYNDAKKNVPDQQFQEELSKRNLTPGDMREGIRRGLVVQKVIDKEVGSKVMVSDQEVTDFFNANKAQFNLPEDAFRLAQIIVTPAPDPQIANRSGDDATTPQAAQTKVAMLMDRLKGGASFADLAMDYSEDPESAPRGGDLGLVPISSVRRAPPALRDAVLNMNVGAARVINQNGAYSIVLVVSKEKAGQRDLTTPGTKEQITNTLKGRKEQLLRTAYLSALRSDAKVTNYVARRIVQANGSVPALGLAAPGT